MRGAYLFLIKDINHHAKKMQKIFKFPYENLDAIFKMF